MKTQPVTQKQFVSSMKRGAKKCGIKLTVVKSGKDVFNFWLENKIANHYILTSQELITKFKEWLPKQSKEWLGYYGWDTPAIVQQFVSSPDGLNSIGNCTEKVNEYEAMYGILNAVLWEYFEKEGIMVN